MDNRKFNLKGGVLIIGSLLWQDYLDEVGDDIRKTWRAEHLLTDNKIMVKAPIRYGRYSQKNQIYTMTFSKSVSRTKLGTGYFVPFRNTVLTSGDDIVNEATALSKAEGMKNKFVANWGASLGILFNDKKIDGKAKSYLTKLWNSKITANNDFNHQSFKKNKTETPCVKSNGQLNFGWVKPVDERQAELLNSFDFLLATATQPTDYPTLKALAENIKSDKERFYFIENYKNGVTTFQDISILNLLE
jgi:hypothetical protein